MTANENTFESDWRTLQLEAQQEWFEKNSACDEQTDDRTDQIIAGYLGHPRGGSRADELNLGTAERFYPLSREEFKSQVAAAMDDWWIQIKQERE